MRPAHWLLDCDPRPVQLEALARSYPGAEHPRRHWGHFLEMRLGKTPLALNEFLMLLNQGLASRLLVIAPNKFKAGWQADAEKFGLGATLPMHTYEARRAKHFDKWRKGLRDRAALLFVNYESLVHPQHYERIARFMNGSTLLVLDESAMVKSPKAQTTKRVRKLAQGAAYVRCLSGLPAPYAPYDFWTQLRLCGMQEFDNFYSFKYRYTRMGGYKGKQPLGLQNEAELDRLIDRYAFRARKVDWGIDKGVDFDQVALEMLPAQARAYREMEDDYVTWITSDAFVAVDTVLAKHMKLQQIASGFLYDEDGGVLQIAPFENTPKFKDLKDRLDNYLIGKVVVVAHYRATIHRLLEALAPWRPAQIVGGMSGQVVEDQKLLFNEDPNCRVLVGQAQALKYGHTLIGSPEDPCLALCFFENTYNLDTRVQCENRPQGAHQQAPIYIWDYHSAPVERKVTTALQKRQKVANVLMGAYRA